METTNISNNFGLIAFIISSFIGLLTLALNNRASIQKASLDSKNVQDQSVLAIYLKQTDEMRQSYQEYKTELEKTIADMRDSSNAQISAAMSTAKTLKVERDNLEHRVTELESQVSKVTDQLNVVKSELDKTTLQLQETKDHLDKAQKIIDEYSLADNTNTNIRKIVDSLNKVPLTK